MMNSDFVAIYAFLYFFCIIAFMLADLKFSDRVMEIQRFLFSLVGKLGIWLILILAVCLCTTVKGLVFGKCLVLGACAVWVYLLLRSPEKIGFKINDIKVSFYSSCIASLHIGAKLEKEACIKVAYQLRDNGVEKLILRSNLLSEKHRHSSYLKKELNRICQINNWSISYGNEVNLGSINKFMIILSIYKTHRFSKNSFRTRKSIATSEGVVTINFKCDYEPIKYNSVHNI
ncbi:hypothetical protein [Pseudoalteromonas lipolytica]|uniref:Uncharacterized protein n=1 Tax=Pseudoalteromonas lipolytica TaxID=570156 RepID=A0ABU8SY55_9GAMM